ncbi:hypothetical protein AWC38_SpisGene24657, partial [Stylophora pistillata]
MECWNRAMDEVLLERLFQKYKDSGGLDSEDPALLMLKIWPASKQYKDTPEKLPGLEELLTLCQLCATSDTDEIPGFLLLLKIHIFTARSEDTIFIFHVDVNDKTKKTLLHYAAELGFLKVAKTLVKKCPLLLSMETKQPWTTKPMFPVEMALLAEKDEVAAYLIRMKWYERVQSLFSWKPDDMTEPEPSFFSFKFVIENPKMK